MSATVTLLVIGIALFVIVLIHVAAYWYVPAVLEQAEEEDEREQQSTA